MAKVSTAEFRKGMHIIHRDEPCQITEMEFVSPGKGTAFFRTKLRNLGSGRTIDFTFRSGEQVEQYDVYSKDLQYLFREGELLTFMDPDTFNQIQMQVSVAGDQIDFMQESEVYQVLLHDDQGVGLRMPKRVILTVTYTEDAARGNTVQNVLKPASLDNGVQVMVPAFVKNGDRIAVNPETREYLERA
jgi:elongation factor P